MTYVAQIKNKSCSLYSGKISNKNPWQSLQVKETEFNNNTQLMERS